MVRLDIKDILLSAREYVSSLKNSPGLLDIVASGEEEKDEEVITQRCLYSPHWPMEKIRQALKVCECALITKGVQGLRKLQVVIGL